MAEFTLNVLYITSKNCFCYLSEEFNKYAQERNVVKVTVGEQSVYLSIGGLLPAPNTNVLGINPVFAKSLNLLENSEVSVRFERNTLPLIDTVTVSPLNRTDYEILELLSSMLEETLLQQVKIVNKGQLFVIWISNFSALKVRVDDISPGPVGWLDILTEIHINQPIFEDIINSPNQNKKSKIRNDDDNIFKKYANNNNTQKTIYNLLPVARLDYKQIASKFWETDYPFTVFIFRKDVPGDCDLEVNCCLACLTCMDSTEHEQSDFYVCLRILDDVTTIKYTKTLFFNKAFLNSTPLRIASKVSLRIVEEKPKIETIKLLTNIPDPDNNLIKRFKQYLRNIVDKQKFIVLNSGFTMQINENEYINSVIETKFCVVTTELLDNCVFTAEFSETVTPASNSYEERDVLCDYYENINAALEKDILLAMELNLNYNWNENVLIVGKRGTGKTALLRRIEQKLSGPLYKIHTEKISCKTIKGKSGESLQRHLFPIIVRSIYYQPSVLIFDDFDIICAKTFSPDPPTPESLYYDRIAEMLESIIESDLQDNKIMFIAATESLDLNEKLFTSRGKHYFKNVYNTSDLNKDLRKGLLQFLFKTKQLSVDVELETLAVKTEGFVIQDLVDLANKAIFESFRAAALTEATAENLVEQKSNLITSIHCKTALESVSEISLQNVNLFTAGERDFSDIGGLDEVKTVLIENLVWPLQFPKLFGSSPLRLQSGLLLYGLPGTGKTILAAAAAKQCGLRLISIKGPELLSKYIGASEQAVRDVFEKAQRAKPCILFFDEFDSLAPRRGHDNTGVTDRVVNQFLTQLDGIESLSGVCVLAATSRPDLLDPALLRPGRLDKQILCPLPDKDARLAIMQALSKKVKLADDVDFQVIAAETEGFSGADLQSLVSTAQLSSLEHLLHSEEKCFENVAVEQSHLVKALKETRPSLSKEEKGKYERIYRNFICGSMEQVKPGQKATFA